MAKIHITFTSDELIEKAGGKIKELRDDLAKNMSEMMEIDNDIRVWINRIILEGAGIIDKDGNILLGKKK